MKMQDMNCHRRRRRDAHRRRHRTLDGNRRRRVTDRARAFDRSCTDARSAEAAGSGSRWEVETSRSTRRTKCQAWRKVARSAREARRPDTQVHRRRSVAAREGQAQVRQVRRDRRRRRPSRRQPEARRSDGARRGRPAARNRARRSASLVFAKGDKEREAREAGADFVGADDMVAKVVGRLHGLRPGHRDARHDGRRR